MLPIEQTETCPAARTVNLAAPPWKSFGIAAGLLTLAFAKALVQVIQLALRTDLHSHILLMPVVTVYLIWLNRRNTMAPVQRSPMAASVAAILGLVVLAGYFAAPISFSNVDALSIQAFAYLLLLWATGFLFFGVPLLRQHSFALSLLIFAVPLPDGLVERLTIFLQVASAEASNLTLRLTGMPVLRDGLAFQLPGLRILVAEECSGIRSTIVLFITSLIGSSLFLQRGWSRALFALAVFPIGIFRNALRITVISWLTVNVDSRIIDSALHHRGGPVFFVISLIPLFVLLWWLRRTEQRRAKK